MSDRITRKDLDLKAERLTELLHERGELPLTAVLRVEFYSYRTYKYNLIRTDKEYTYVSNVSDCMTNQMMYYYLLGAIRTLTQSFTGRELW